MTPSTRSTRSSAFPTAFAAVDLGATSGRVIVGRVGPGNLDLTEVHRFDNTPVQLPTGLHWDILALYRSVLAGLREAGRSAEIMSIGVDSWAVDYGLLDASGALLGNPLPLGQSLLLIWPQLTGLIAGVIVLFVAAYVIFQRQEVRA